MLVTATRGDFAAGDTSVGLGPIKQKMQTQWAVQLGRMVAMLEIGALHTAQPQPIPYTGKLAAPCAEYGPGSG